MKKLILSFALAGAMGFLASPAMSQESVGTKGYEEVDHFCGEIETYRCRWNDLTSCDISGQELCD
jgi:hypothetical protein